MSDHEDDGSYYAAVGVVYKRPLRVPKEDGTENIKLGFPVCVLCDGVSDDGAAEIAEALNKRHYDSPGERHLPELLEALREVERNFQLDGGACGLCGADGKHVRHFRDAHEPWCPMHTVWDALDAAGGAGSART